MVQAAKQLCMPYTTYVNYEKGTREPKSAALIAIARFYNTSIDYLLGKSDLRIDDATLDLVNTIDQDILAETGNIKDALQMQAARSRKEAISDEVPLGFEPLPKMVKTPLVGTIACGEPITAEQNIEAYVDAPESMRCDFCLRCKGDSMIDAGIHDGDIVYIHIQSEVANGRIAAVCIDGEATLKRVYWSGDTLTLLAENSNFAPLVYTGPALDSVRIEGLAVGWTHWI